MLYVDNTDGVAKGLLLATVNEAALYIANAPDPPAASDDAVAAMDLVLSGLARTPRLSAAQEHQCGWTRPARMTRAPTSSH
jgi:ATP-dependent Zn protease